jgi:hypothetical protein
MKNSPLVIRLPSDEKQAMLADKEQGVGSTFDFPPPITNDPFAHVNDGFGSRAEKLTVSLYSPNWLR